MKLEIDGEFFENPRDERLREKALAIASLVINSSLQIVKIYADNKTTARDKESFIYMSQMRFKLHLATIQSAPLFPGALKGEVVNIPTGGIVPPNDLAMDVMRIPEDSYVFERKPVKIVTNMEKLTKRLKETRIFGEIGRYE